MSNHTANHPPELDWPFFENSHRDFKVRLDAWCQEHLAHAHHDESRDAVDAECIRLVRLLGSGGWLRHTLSMCAPPGRAPGGRPLTVNFIVTVDDTGVKVLE